MRLLVENRVQAAYDKAFEALGLAPDMAAPNIAAATVLQTKGEFEAALARAQTGLAADPLSEPALLRVTELLLGLNRVREARQVMAGFTGAKSGRFHMTQGFLFLIGHDTARALTSFETALAMDRDLARAWVGLGLAQYAQGQIRPGLEKLETASLLDPLSAFPHNYLGKAMYEVEEYEEAKTEFVRARQLDPNDPTPWLYLAILAQDHFAPAESMRHLKKAIDMNDNRFVSRSRFLLDMDRSVKNINLAKSLSDLGMNEWARHMGNRAIWEDPANSAAYLFRGAEALSLSRVDVSTLSDLKRAQLLNPVNSNTFPSYTDYYSLMELPEHIRILEGYAGTDDTFGSTFTARGGINRHSYRVSAHADTTDGPSDGTGSSDRYVDVQYKAEPVQNHQFMFGVQGGINEKEDLVPRQNGFARANDDVTDTGYHQINGGYHWRVSAGQDLLISLQYQYRDSDSVKNRQFELVPNVWYNWADFLVQKDERYRAEVIDLIRFQNHAVTLGGSLGRLDRDLDDVQTITPASSPGTIVSQLTSDAGPRETEVRVFARDLWSVTDALTLDLGMGWCRFDSDSKDDRTRFLPQAGAMLALGKENLVRAAFYREIQPDYLSATLQPVEVAGFSSITGDPSGTLTSAWGLAFDRQWGSRYFTSIEAGFKEKEYNTAYLPHPGLAKSWNSEDTSFLGLTLNYLISEHYALSLTQRFTEIEPDVPGLDRKDSETGVRLTGVYPFGLTLQTAWWFVDQDFDDAGAAGMDGDRFVIGSLSARQRLFNKKMELFLRLDNILDQSFNYVPEESITGLDLPWQGAFFLAGFRVTF
jgi:tetratricopeptide (TPR) repeat protein